MTSRPRTTPAAANGHDSHHYYPPLSSSSASASFRGCCCCLILLIFFLALLVLAVILVVVLALKPRKPEFSLNQVSVQYMGISPTTTASSADVSVNIRMLLNFTAANHNKVEIKYDESRFTVMYRGIPLGRGTVPGFDQPAHSERQVEATIVVDRVSLLQADAADLLRDASLSDRVELRIVGDVGAKVRILGLISPVVQQPLPAPFRACSPRACVARLQPLDFCCWANCFLEISATAGCPTRSSNDLFPHYFVS